MHEWLSRHFYISTYPPTYLPIYLSVCIGIYIHEYKPSGGAVSKGKHAWCHIAAIIKQSRMILEASLPGIDGSWRVPMKVYYSPEPPYDVVLILVVNIRQNGSRTPYFVGTVKHMSNHSQEQKLQISVETLPKGTKAAALEALGRSGPVSQPRYRYAGLLHRAAWEHGFNRL